MDVWVTREEDRRVEVIRIEITAEELFTLSLDRLEELIEPLILEYEKGEATNSCALLKLALMAKHYEMKGAIDDFLRLKS